MDLRHLPPSPSPGLVNLLVEIPAGSRNKYEYCAQSGLMVLDRVLHASVRYPFDYGFIPNTLSDDGDPADVLVVSDYPVVPGAVIEAKPVGVLIMEDEKGMDEKIIAVPAKKLNSRFVRLACSPVFILIGFNLIICERSYHIYVPLEM